MAAERTEPGQFDYADVLRRSYRARERSRAVIVRSRATIARAQEQVAHSIEVWIRRRATKILGRAPAAPDE